MSQEVLRNIIRVIKNMSDFYGFIMEITAELYWTLLINDTFPR